MKHEHRRPDPLVSQALSAADLARFPPPGPCCPALECRQQPGTPAPLLAAAAPGPPLESPGRGHPSFVGKVTRRLSSAVRSRVP